MRCTGQSVLRWRTSPIEVEKPLLSLVGRTPHHPGACPVPQNHCLRASLIPPWILRGGCSGYCFAGSLPDRLGLLHSYGAAFHDWHHTHNAGNFGTNTCFWDHICGTYDHYLVYERLQETKIFPCKFGQITPNGDRRRPEWQRSEKEDSGMQP